MELINFVLTNYLKNKTIVHLANVKIYKQLIYSWLRKFKIKNKLVNWQMNFNQNNNLFNDKSLNQIEIDDTFINIQQNKETKKIGIRQIVFHNGFQNSKNKNFSFLIFWNVSETKKRELLHLTYQTIKKYLHNDVNYTLKGDGAKWIERLSKQLKLDFVLDKFHLFKYLNWLFKIPIHIKSNKIVKLKDYVHKKIKVRWLTLFINALKFKTKNTF
ncbi:UPF0236 family transposase-like protein [Mycoplasmopsis columbina]|uniref:UPF0236 family transposase-like protein n=1 Tax=Mycoplasmopsis columbina TaxID=114881 RepID=UPI0004A73A15|nr:UPF0236 family protein [Mycoplasmopsis columbina]VEU76881.1 Uncharacterised protein [Mycoplasmopsis columbina]